MSSRDVAPPAATAVPSEPTAPKRRSPLAMAGGGLAGAVAVVAPVLIVSGLFLSLYTSHHLLTPTGADTTQYMWRTKLVEAHGLGALKTPLPNPNQPNADRPGFPVLAAIEHAITGVDPLTLAYVFPAVVAAIIALAAGSFAREAMREPSWAFPVYAVLIGAGVNVAITANGYFDNLLVDGVLLAAATAALLATDGRPAVAAAIFLVAAAVSIHWIFVVFLAVLFAGLAVLLLPESVRSMRGGTSVLKTPSVRIATVIAGALPLGIGTALLAPALRGPPQHLRLTGQLRKLRDQLPFYKVRWVAPAAAAGAAATALPPRAPRIRSLLFLGMWALTPLPLVYLLHHGHPVPAQRILGFDFGLPLLAVAAFVGVARFLSAKLWWPGRAVAAAFVLAAMAGGAFLGYRAWYTRQPSFSPNALPALMEAGEYVGMTPPSSKVVFVVQQPMAQFPQVASFRRLRAFTPADRVGDVYVYLGTAAQALAGTPRQPGVWTVLGPIMRTKPVLVVSALYDNEFGALQREHPSWVVGHGLLVLRGPRPARQIPTPAPVIPPKNGTLYGHTAALLVLLFVAGLGWAVALLPTGWLARAGTAPAFGVGALVLGGLVADNLGFGLDGGSGVAIAIGAAAAGWLVVLGRNGRWRKPLARRSSAVALPSPNEASETA